MDNLTCYSIWIVILSVLTDGAAGAYCTKYSYPLDSTTLFYCSTSCCGTLFKRYCCKFSFGVSLISGIVVACLVAIGIIVAVICICAKNKAKKGRVVQPGRTQITVVYAATNMQTQGGIGAPAQQGFYNNYNNNNNNQFVPGQPGFNNNNPSAYQSSNPTGKVMPVYPSLYQDTVAGPAVYDVPPPSVYINPAG